MDWIYYHHQLNGLQTSGKLSSIDLSNFILPVYFHQWQNICLSQKNDIKKIAIEKHTQYFFADIKDFCSEEFGETGELNFIDSCCHNLIILSHNNINNINIVVILMFYARH